jgi:[ribosomal protein S5]-alanine N-acetyltransferase
MHYEGRMRETTLIRDGWRDSDLYSVLADEWHGDGGPMRPDGTRHTEGNLACT